VVSEFIRCTIGAIVGTPSLFSWMRNGGVPDLRNFGVSPLDPFTYGSVLIVLAASAVLASYPPARRAAAVNPVEALRAE